MFNPQRKSKVNDIYMQQKWYQMHIGKIKNITHSTSPQKQRQAQQKQQQIYLHRLSLSKKQVQNRLSTSIKHSNHKLFLKLLQTDTRQQSNPQNDYFKSKKKHFNHYYSSKKQMKRVKDQNFTMVTRMMYSESQVPTLKDCKQASKRTKKLLQKCSKLPSIFQHQQQFKKKFSKRYLEESQFKSRVKTSRLSNLRLMNDESQINQKKSQDIIFFKQIEKQITQQKITTQHKSITQTKTIQPPNE